MITFAQPSDSEAVAPLMFQAMEEIAYKLIGEENKTMAIDFLQQLFEQENTQYSYHNTLIFKEKDKILGSLVFYDGAKLTELRQPVLEASSKISGKKILLENETQAGEIYIDTLSVLPSEKGKGIGTKLIEYLKNYCLENQFHTIGLLVDVNNHRAEKLYTRLGFSFENFQNLAGGCYKHLTFKAV